MHMRGNNLKGLQCQRIKGFLLFHEIEEPMGLERWTIQAVQTLAQMPVNEMLHEVLDDYLEELWHVRHRFIALERKLSGYTSMLHQRRLACLQSVPGVGRIVACSFLSELFALNVSSEGLLAAQAAETKWRFP